ncbi:MAG: lipopolysaccharide biosynthesis protein [Burkholderiaceae bacterium]
MTIGRRILFAVSVSWLSRLVVIGLGLVLIPILFRHMGKEELGLWFLLGQSGAFLGLMDMGVSPTLTRRIAFAKGGHGTDVNAEMSKIAQLEIADLIATGKLIYRYLTAGVFLIAWVTGFLFIGQIDLVQLDHRTIWIAWTVLCVSHALGVWAAMWSCLLQGTGHVGWDGLIGIAVQVVTLIAQIAAVLLGGGLITLAAIAAIGAITTRYAVLILIRSREPDLFRQKGHWNHDAFRSMVKPALKAWATGLGAFLILKTDQYFIAYLIGVDNIPSYQATLQLISNLMMLSLALAISSQVFISQLWQARQLKQIHRIVQRNLRFALIVMACGSACMLMVGEELMSLWLGPGHFIGYPILIVFCVMLFLEVQHSAVASASRSTEDEAFVFCALSAGVLNLVLTWWLIKPYGLMGVALGTMLAQILTNNWYAVYRGLWRLQLPLRQYFYSVLLPVLMIFALAVFTAAIGKALLGNDAHAAWVLAVGIAITGSVCAGALWFLVLEATQRQRLWRRISILLKR